MGHLQHRILLSDKKELQIHTTTWIDLKGMLRENGQCDRGYTE